MLDDNFVQDGKPKKPLLYKIAIGFYLIPLSLALIGFLPIGMYSGQSFLYGMFFSVPVGIVVLSYRLSDMFRKKNLRETSQIWVFY